jgi:hypothetical protein
VVKMTAIAIWRTDEDPDTPLLWVAADSLISQSSMPLLHDASKVFQLSVTCQSPGAHGFFTETYHTHSYGYCFAGSTLLGQNTYLAVAPLLANLASPTQYVPSLKDVADYVGRYVRSSFDEFKIIAGTGAFFEIAIFGFCPQTRMLSAYRFFPQKINDVYSITCEMHQNMEDKDFIYLGDQKERLTAAISAAFIATSLPGRPSTRAPRYIIEDHIENDLFPSIGGDLQLGIADARGFRGLLLCKPRVKGRPEAYFSYLGRELTDDLRFVGQAIVGSTAMA